MKANLKNKKPGKPTAVPPAKRNNRIWLLVIIPLAAMAIAYLLYNKKSAINEGTTPAAVQDATPVQVSPGNLEGIVKKLTGRWQRTDGGYIIELKNPSPDGRIEATYFNPNPIHVGRAGWQDNAGKVIVTVELQDVNYPGSLYTLEFVHKEDRLSGVYFQAVEKLNYDVGFTRIQ